MISKIGTIVKDMLGMDIYAGIKDSGGIYITEKELKRIIKTHLPTHIHSNISIIVADSQYYCPSLQYVKDILKVNKIDTLIYRSQAFDCDDFARLLSAEFIKLAYKDNDRRAPFAFAFVYGKFPHPHAINMFIDDQKNLYFIEPQSDDLILPTHPDIKSIYVLVI